MRSNTKFCSVACKQKAYRAKKTDPMTTYINRKERVKSAIETKKTLERQFDCEVCGKTIDTDYLHGMQRYCSNACKQRLYRSNKSKRGKAEKLAQFDNVSSWIELQAMIDSLTSEFEIIWKWNWLLAGCQVIYDGGYRLKNEVGQVAYIQTLELAVRWVKDYFTNGKPNQAMIRWR
jgi:predicted nucleic acid-binding Zn ribbon protein